MSEKCENCGSETVIELYNKLNEDADLVMVCKCTNCNNFTERKI